MEAITIRKVEAEAMTIKEFKEFKGLPMTAYDRPWEEGYHVKEYCRITDALLSDSFMKKDVFDSLYTTAEGVEKAKALEIAKKEAEAEKRKEAQAALEAKLAAHKAAQEAESKPLEEGAKTLEDKVDEEPLEEVKPKRKRRTKAQIEAEKAESEEGSEE